jgi:hypothetical protein
MDFLALQTVEWGARFIQGRNRHHLGSNQPQAFFGEALMEIFIVPGSCASRVEK